ncbi:uncharacterized protein LOC133834070 [Humulus lupulus]|uniref:uncharacterized protein LOC133834070 n=1 Tax=Humulus lupulus TaxID=3486 RepID=UPI002B40EC9E|nr:uncharacterized protein LOC133834070 [Humulus lupulus]
MFQKGRSSEGPLVKKLRATSKKTPSSAVTASKSPTKGKGSGSGAPPAAPPEKRGPAIPPPRFPLALAQDQVAPVGPPAPVVPTATVRILINAQDLEQIPDTFRGTVYEMENLEHFYKAEPNNLRAIEERIPENVVLAQHRSISRARTRNDELKAELQTAQAAFIVAQAALVASQQSEQSAKAVLAAAQADEQAAKAALTTAQEAEQAAKATSEALQTELEGAKAKQLEVEVVIPEEKKASTSSMESKMDSDLDSIIDGAGAKRSKRPRAGAQKVDQLGIGPKRSKKTPPLVLPVSSSVTAQANASTMAPSSQVVASTVAPTSLVDPSAMAKAQPPVVGQSSSTPLSKSPSVSRVQKLSISTHMDAYAVDNAAGLLPSLLSSITS